MSWLVRILSQEDLSQYKKEADHWGTCALHEIDLLVPGIVVLDPLLKCPTDYILFKLGQEFPIAVRKDNHRRAFRIYREIQARVAVLAGVK